MKIRIQQKELRQMRDECDTNCQDCRYNLRCQILWAAQATTKTPNRFGTKDIKSIAEYLKNEF